MTATEIQRLTGRAALVTGAGRGIGRAIALALASEGVRVALLARSANELDEVAQTIRSLGGESLVLPDQDVDAVEVVSCPPDRGVGGDPVAEVCRTGVGADREHICAHRCAASTDDRRQRLCDLEGSA